MVLLAPVEVATSHLVRQVLTIAQRLAYDECVAVDDMIQPYLTSAVVALGTIGDVGCCATLMFCYVKCLFLLTNVKRIHTVNVGEVGAYPHTEACPHTLLFAHRVTSG